MHIMGIKSREGVKWLSIERCTRYLWGHPHVLLPLEAKTGWTGDDSQVDSMNVFFLGSR